MKNNSAKKAIALYYILSFSLTLPFLVPLWFIDGFFWVLFYFIGFFIYATVAVNFAVRVTVMSSLGKELDAEKYAAIIKAKPFLVHYSYKLNLYFSTGDYQSAYNIISSVLLQHKNVQQRIYGHLLLCRICFERGDYEGIKEHIDKIDNYFIYNPNLKFPKTNRESYEFYRAFYNADYDTALSISEKGINKYSKKKNRAYFVVMRKYQLAVIKRRKGELDEATALFEEIKERAPKLFTSTLAQKQLEYISGELEEKVSEPLGVTEKYTVKSRGKSRIVLVVILGIIFALLVLEAVLEKAVFEKVDEPLQEVRDLEYEAKIESALYDDYEEYRILGYCTVYSDGNYEEVSDTVFLVEFDGKVDLHSLYKIGEEYGNTLNVSDIQIDRPYVYQSEYSENIELVLTEKKENIPDSVQYYYEIDGYYFCVISVTDIATNIL